jgi:hypothetical protein
MVYGTKETFAEAVGGMEENERASLVWADRKTMNYERATFHLGCDSQVAQVEAGS